MNLSNLLQIAREISDTVSLKVKNTQSLGNYIGTIGMSGDQTKVGDQTVENELKNIVPIILKKYNINNYWLVSEETGQLMVGEINENSDGIFLIIDPIDGSNNLRPHGTPKPFVGFSIAIGTLNDLFSDGKFSAVSAGVVRDIFHDETYWTIKGRGSHLENISLVSSPVTDLSDTVLGVSLDRMGEKLQKNFDLGIYDLLLNTRFQRRLGLSSLDLCRVATGDYDVHVSLNGDIKVHDIAAVKMIIEEAGGIVELYKDNKLVNNEKWLLELFKKGNQGIKDIKFSLIAAGNKDLLEKVKKYLKLV
ncbi:MAG: inositol monophosphatase family protein [Candidatus Magasanikiibacteriota bacterium]